MHTRQQSAASLHSESSKSSQIAAVCHHTIGQTKTNIEIGGTKNHGDSGHSKRHL